jgi:HK97 family phage major capsid protein
VKTLEELRSAAASLAVEIDELSKLEAPTDEQTARFDAALAEVDTLADEIRAAEAAEEARVAREAKLDEIRAFAAKPKHVQSGDGARVAPVVGATSRNIWDKDEARMASNSPREYAAELRSRAAKAIEDCDAIDGVSEQGARYNSNEFKEQATRRLEKQLDGDSQHLEVANRWIDFGNPEYRDNWKRAMRGDMAAQQFCQSKTFEHESQRAAWAVDGTTTTGGYALVPDYDVSLLLINAGTTNPMRQIADVRQTNVNKVYGLSTAGMSVGWITESTEEGDDTPTVAQPSWDIQRASGYIQASFETVADTNLGAEVAMLFNDAKDTLEATAFVLGTGGGEPFGVVTRAASLNAYVFGDSGSTVEAELKATDIYALDNALGPRWRENAAFLANKITYNGIRQLSTSAAGTFWVDLGGGLPAQLIGYPCYQSSVMDSTVVSGSEDNIMLLGDFRAGYRIYDRIGTTVAFNPLVVGGSGRRPTGEVGWFFYWRTSGDVTDQTNASHFKLLHK